MITEQEGVPTRPRHVEVELHHLIASTRLSQPRPDRRLNGIENTLASLVRVWRPIEPIEPTREIRMSSATLANLLGWIEEREVAGGQTRTRIARYLTGEVADNSVPLNWVRVLLPLEESSAPRERFR